MHNLQQNILKTDTREANSRAKLLVFRQIQIEKKKISRDRDGWPLLKFHFV